MLQVSGKCLKTRGSRSLYAQIKSEKGKLDIVFANAGVAIFAQFGQITRKHFDSIFNVNVQGRCYGRKLFRDAGWRIDHPECIHRRQQRTRSEQRLQRDKGGYPFLCQNVDDGPEEPQNSGDAVSPVRSILRASAIWSPQPAPATNARNS